MPGDWQGEDYGDILYGAGTGVVKVPLPEDTGHLFALGKCPVCGKWQLDNRVRDACRKIAKERRARSGMGW